MLEIGCGETWLWVAVEPIRKQILGVYISRHRNMIVVEAFLSALIRFYGKPTVYSDRSEEYTFELQSHSFISYAVFCLKKKKNTIFLQLANSEQTPSDIQTPPFIS